MAEYLKRGAPHGSRATPEVRDRVQHMLENIEIRGEAAVREYSQQLDGWNPPSFRLSPEAIERSVATVDEGLREHIIHAAQNIRRFAEAQLATMRPVEVEVELGSVLGHRHVPVRSVGAYVPAGRYPLISSALMSILTAKVAGVERVVAMSAPLREGGLWAPTLFAMTVAGADEVYALGGVQAMGAMAFGVLPGLEPVDMLVGAGNAYVAEAKRQLFGLVGIDLLAGPTEVLIIADESASPQVVAIDLLAQAEHGPTSPAVLVTTSRSLGEEVLQEIGTIMPTWPTKDTAGDAWNTYGTIVVAGDQSEAASLSDEFAPEHLQLMVANPSWYHDRLRNYGSLFIGEETTVAFGDKAVGTNHTLPTQRASRYTGGLWVGKYLKTLTYDRMTSEASKELAVVAAAISRAEGLLGHALSADIRLDLAAVEVRKCSVEAESPPSG